MRQTLQGFKAELFKALAHPVRIRILELLRSGEKNVSELQGYLDTESSSVSQQLALLRAKNIVQTRKAGTSVYYSVRDPRVFVLLDVAREIFDGHVIDLQSMADADESSALRLAAVGPADHDDRSPRSASVLTASH